VYDFKLDYAPEGDDARLSARMAASQGTLPDPLGTEGNSAPDFFVAVQEQLGLRLEPIKGSIEVLVIDEATRVPTEN
jgi:uncharacterized protein (TIGR03435 family)